MRSDETVIRPALIESYRRGAPNQGSYPGIAIKLHA